MKKKKIVIIGGGPAGLTAAFDLTDTSGWNDKYDVIVYQQGWRLGGKCHTGRGPQGRIEEHGPHVLLGWYDKTFRMLRKVYQEMEPESPFGRECTNAFKAEDSMLMTSYSTERQTWECWPAIFHSNNDLPGEGAPKDLWDRIEDVLITGLEVWFSPPREVPGGGTLQLFLLSAFAKDTVGTRFGLRGWLLPLATRGLDQIGRLFKRMPPAGGSAEDRSSGPLDIPFLGDLLRSRVRTMVRELKEPHPGVAVLERPLLRFLTSFQHLLRLTAALSNNGQWDKDVALVNLAISCIAGALEDKVWDPVTQRWNFDAVEHRDFRDWLKDHGAGPETLDSPLVRFVYSGTFADQIGKLAAGTALAAVLEFLGYKGHLVWLSKAGTGDSVIAPLYQVLKNRGVKFEFFHRVEKIHDSGTDDIEEVTVQRQVTLKNDKVPYDPLVPLDVEGGTLQTWPRDPRYAQLDDADAAAIKKGGIDLESPWAHWPPAGPGTRSFSLKKGTDFDVLILAIPIKAVEEVCPEIVESHPSWKKMVADVTTTATMSVQLWLELTMEELGIDPKELGLPANATPNTESYEPPLSSWNDSTQMLPFEAWPKDRRPRSLAFFTGAMPDPDGISKSASPDFPQQQLKVVQDIARDWLQKNMGYFWPKAATSAHGKGFNFDLLVSPDDSHKTGAEKFLAQHFRANISPSDRYTLAVPGSKFSRLSPDETGFRNLMFAGDWVRHESLNAGFFESAVAGGQDAAKAAIARLAGAGPD